MTVLFLRRLLRAKRTCSGRGKSVENDPKQTLPIFNRVDREPLHHALAQHAGAELDRRHGEDHRVRQEPLEDLRRRERRSLLSPEDASPVSKSSMPGVARAVAQEKSSTTANDAEQQRRGRRTRPTGLGWPGPDRGRPVEEPAVDGEREEDAARRSSSRRCPEKPPRSVTWNQWALTLTIETAPKLWKYMFTA